MTVLFIGTGFFPWMTSGEKNFFLNLFPILQKKKEVVVFSLNDLLREKIIYKTIVKNIPVYCARRPFHSNYEKYFFNADGYTSYHHRHKPAREILEKLISIIWYLPLIKKILKDCHVDVIHFMDNFGPSMPLLKTIFPKKIVLTYSAANYDPRGNRGKYDLYLKFSLRWLDGIGVYTEAYKKIINMLDINAPCFLTPWGVPISDKRLTVEQKTKIRNKLGVGKEQYLLLWSGYIQQIQEADFYKSIKIAREVVRVRPDITFLFAFKPETFRKEYIFESGERIKIVSGVKEFGRILEAADLLYSPISNIYSTVSPPLTWIEAMSKGTPVLTTNVGGVDEIISQGKTGYIADSYDDAAELIIHQTQRDNLKLVSERAVDEIYKRYTIQHAAASYLDMWRQLSTS